MGSRKKVKKKAVKKVSVSHEAIVDMVEMASRQVKLDEAIECLKGYAKKELIGDLANPAIELLTKWGKI